MHPIDRRERIVEWLKILAIVAVVAILLTRVPLIIAFAGEEEAKFPTVCLSGAGAVSKALETAPRSAAFDEGTPLSGCFTRASDTGDVQQISEDFLAAASPLARAAQGDPEGREALRLGFLIGAVERGAGTTQGIHNTMLRRMQQEALGLEGRSRAYESGLEAGRTRG